MVVKRFVYGVCLGGLALCFMAAGCKEDDPLAFSTKTTQKNLCNELAEVMCHNIFECCQGDEIEANFGVEITTEEDMCRRDMELQCEEYTSALRHAVAAGRATLRTKNIDACLRAYVVGKDGCFPYVTEFAPECAEPMTQGNVAVGGECLHVGESFECVENAFCNVNRKCKGLASVGEECGSSAECAAGLFCGVNADATATVCQPLKAAGEECDSSLECNENLVCLSPDDVSPATCTVKKAIGESCDRDEICNSAYCLPGTCQDASEAECLSDEYCTGTCRDSQATCTNDASCGGTCEISGYTCYDESDCGGICQNYGSTCYTDSDCPGVCAVYGNACYDDSYCDTTIAGNVCAFSDVCVQDACVSTDVCEGAATCGGRVCAEYYFTANYCDMSLFGFFDVGD